MALSKNFIFIAFGWAVSIAMIVVVFQSAPISDILTALKTVEPLYIILGMVFSSISIMLRGGRWSRLFLPHYDLSKKGLSLLLLVGMGVNAIFPGRVGDIVRLGLTVKKYKTGVAFTLATIVVERWLDGITLLLLLGLSFMLLPDFDVSDSLSLFGYSVSGGMVVHVIEGLVVACLLISLVLVLLLITKSRQIISATFGGVPVIGRWVRMLEDKILHDVLRGLDSLKIWGNVLQLHIYSIIIWSSLIVCNFLVSLGIDGLHLTFAQAVVVTAISITVSSIPSAPGSWGVFEAGALLSLVVLGVHFDQAVGVAYVLAIHISQYVPVLLFGLAAAMAEQLSFRKIRDINQSAERQ